MVGIGPHDGDRTLTPKRQTTDPNQTARLEMVRYQIAARGIQDKRVLDAMAKVPRERFIPERFQEQAFADRALPIAEGQTISQPFMVASMTAQLQIQPHHRILEIGTGSGYQTTILSRLAREVVTIERIGSLQKKAREMLATLNVSNVTFQVGDGTAGWVEHAPYDGIIVTAGAPTIPDPLVEQLTDGGVLVLPVGGEKEQVLILVTRKRNKIVRKKLFPCRFVKLIGQHGWQ